MMLKFRKVSLPVMKHYLCTLTTSKYILEHLKDKSVISVIGDEASIYLQGLITNDINHLSNDLSSQFTMFLNSKGRVICDAIIYRIDNKTYSIECDRSIAADLTKHLNMYRLRRKISVTLSNHQVHSLFSKEFYELMTQRKEFANDQHFLSSICLPSFQMDPEIKLFKDPRILHLGYRVISEQDSKFQSRLSDVVRTNVETVGNMCYRKLRYSLGVGEGTIDLPPGNCFPLESNCDYLHGISFHKGCYIGQELTARTYHTGVTRKRLMPLYFDIPLSDSPIDTAITHEKSKLGKLRGVQGNFGLALLRTDLVSTLKKIKIANTEAAVGKPFWWPLEAPKDKMSFQKN